MAVDEISKLIEQLHLRVSKDFKKMNLPQLSNELRSIMDFESQTFQKIEDLEKKGLDQDMLKYAKIICKNNTQREITEIQGIYLKKIDSEYLNSK